MQTTLYIKVHQPGNVPTSQVSKSNTRGTSSNPYHMDALDMKLYITKPPQQTIKMEQPPLQSPYTCVYGMREVYKTSKNIQSITNPNTSQNTKYNDQICNTYQNTRHICKTNKTLQSKHSNPYQIISHNTRINRRMYTLTTSQQRLSKVKHPTLQSPHTRVCGKRWVFNKNKHIKTKPYTNTTTCLIKVLSISPYIKSKGHFPYTSTYSKIIPIERNCHPSQKKIYKNPIKTKPIITTNTHTHRNKSKIHNKHTTLNSHLSQYSKTFTQTKSIQYSSLNTAPIRHKASMSK